MKSINNLSLVKSSIRFKGGFTLVELIVVITVISILTGIGAVSYSQHQTTTRNAQRSSQATLIAEALEEYYNKNGEYPSCTAMTQSMDTVRNITLEGIDPTILIAPQSATKTNSITCAAIGGITTDVFSYIGDGSATCASGTSCLEWQLSYRDEGTGNIVTISSRHKTAVATSGIPSLVCTASSFSQIDCSWNQTSNAVTYTLERATDSGFTTSVVSQSYSGASASATGLAADTTYYFRIKAIATNSVGDWSNTANAKTWNLTVPSVTTTVLSATSVRANWNTIANTTSYTVQYSTDNATWTTVTGQTGTSYTLAGLNQGGRYYFNVKAVNGAYSSPWSPVASATTPITAPAAYNMNYAQMSWNILRGSANLAACPAGTTYMYHWYHTINGVDSFWVGGAQYQIVDHGLTWGQTVTLSVATRCESPYTVSGWTWANNNTTMSLVAPTVSSWLASYRTAGWGGTCPAGSTSHGYYWRVHGTGNVGDTGWQGPTTATSWNGTAYTWGDGTIRAFLHCVGPWGTVSSPEVSAAFGAGCVSQPFVAACYW